MSETTSPRDPGNDSQLFRALRALDTPTVCNALELLDPAFRTTGFTTTPFVCATPDLAPVVGYARTATIRASTPPPGDKGAVRDTRIAYYRHVEGPPRPTVAVIQDIDETPGFGAFWGEVQTAIHMGLGCKGLVTNGAIRDLDVIAPGFRMLAGRVGPSHAWVHLVEVGVAVKVAGMRVRPGDLIHADRHGAVSLPRDLAAKVPEAAALLGRREAVIIAAAKAPGFSADALAAAMGEADDIH